MPRIIQLSDIHFGGEDSAATEAALQFTLDDKPDVTLVTGDVTLNGLPREFEAAKAWLDSMPTAINVAAAIFPYDIKLVLFDPDTLKEELVEGDPMKRVDFGSANFSDLTDELIATVYQDDKNRIYWKDKKFEADYNLIKSRLGDREIALLNQEFS